MRKNLFLSLIVSAGFSLVSSAMQKNAVPGMTNVTPSQFWYNYLPVAGTPTNFSGITSANLNVCQKKNPVIAATPQAATPFPNVNIFSLTSPSTGTSIASTPSDMSLSSLVSPLPETPAFGTDTPTIPVNSPINAPTPFSTPMNISLPLQQLHTKTEQPVVNRLSYKSLNLDKATIAGIIAKQTNSISSTGISTIAAPRSGRGIRMTVASANQATATTGIMSKQTNEAFPLGFATITTPKARVGVKTASTIINIAAPSGVPRHLDFKTNHFVEDNSYDFRSDPAATVLAAQMGYLKELKTKTLVVKQLLNNYQKYDTLL